MKTVRVTRFRAAYKRLQDASESHKLAPTVNVKKKDLQIALGFLHNHVPLSEMEQGALRAQYDNGRREAFEEVCHIIASMYQKRTAEEVYEMLQSKLEAAGFVEDSV